MIEVVKVLAGGLIGALITLVIFLVTRNDQKKEKSDIVQKEIDAIKKDQLLIKRDVVRINLMMLMYVIPCSEHELMTCAKQYFVELEGDWYMTPIFFRYIEEKGIAKPEWLIDKD